MAATVLEKYTWRPTVRRTSTGAAISGVDVHVWDGAATPVKVVNGLSTDANGQIAEQQLQKASHSVATTTTTTTTTTPHIARFVKFGEIAIEFQQNIQTQTTPTFYTDTQTNLTETTKATVTGWNGYTLNHTSELITTTTGAGSIVDRTSRLYDRGQAEAEDDEDIDILQVMETVDGQNFTLYYSWTVDNIVFDGEDKTVAFDTGKDLTIQGASGDVQDLAVTGDVNLGTATGGQALTNLDVTGSLDFSVSGSYNLTDCQINEVTNSSGGNVTLYLLGNSSVTTNTGPNITVESPVTVKVHVDDNTGTNLQNARVYLRAADNSGPLPYLESVTITRAGTTATVAHTSHGLVSTDKVKIEGITDKTEDNNGVHAITIVNANQYTYTTTDSGSTSYTGSITSTGVLIEGLTDVNGDISINRTFLSAQPVSGYVRKSTASPRFKTRNLAGNTVSTSAGLTINVRLVLDE